MLKGNSGNAGFFQMTVFFTSSAGSIASRRFDTNSCPDPIGSFSILRNVLYHPYQKQRDDVDDLYHRIYCGSCRVLIWVADGISRNRRLMRGRFFPTVVSLLNIFFCVVPRRTTRGHGKRHKKTGDNGADQDTAKRLWPKNEGGKYWNCDGNKGWHDHFTDGGFRYDINRFAIVRLCRSLHDAFYLAELSPHLFYDTGGRF